MLGTARVYYETRVSGESAYGVVRPSSLTRKRESTGFTLRVTAGVTTGGAHGLLRAEHRPSIRHPCAASKFRAVAAGAGLALAGSDRRTTAAC